jgi:C-terminal processing protease CtpA/Prc
MYRMHRTAALALAALALLAAPSFAETCETIVVETTGDAEGTYIVTTELKDGLMVVDASAIDDDEMIMFVEAGDDDDSEAVKKVRVMSTGKPSTWLGVGIQELDQDMIEAMDLEKDVKGVLINEIYEGSPAEAAGLEKGDVVLSFDGEAVHDVKTVVTKVRENDPGETVEVTVLREGRKMTLMATLGEREQEEMLWVSPDLGNISMEFLDALEGIQIRIPEIELGMAGFARRGKLGVYVEDIGGGLAEYFEVPDGKGVLVQDVVEDGAADKAGIKAGDVIIRIGDERIINTATLVKAIATTESGEPTVIGIVRKGSTMDVTATIEHPEVDGDELRYKLLMMEGATDAKTRAMMLKDLSEEEREKLEEELDNLREELQELKEELREMKSD